MTILKYDPLVLINDSQIDPVVNNRRRLRETRGIVRSFKADQFPNIGLAIGVFLIAFRLILGIKKGAKK